MKHLKLLSLLIAMLLSMPIITSCSEDEEETLETLVPNNGGNNASNGGGNTTCLISVKYSEGGTATTSDTEVMPGWEVTLTATPNEGYIFVNWTVNGEEVSKDNPYTTTITASTQFKANFEKDIYKVTVTASEGGTAEVDKTKVFPNKEVILTATPNEGFRFVNWTLNGVEVSKENPYTATVTANSVYVANFEVLPTNNVHAYVDLGLSVKWATCNVGADFPEDHGDYFAWGETTPKTTYNWSTYKYCNGDQYSMTKYCTSSSYGTVDNKTTLELSDDAAHVNWGGSWRMPTRAEQDELRNTNNCTWEWTTQNGVNGYKVTSKKNGNSIFLPAAGCRDGILLLNAGRYGYCWSSSLNTSRSYYAYYVYFGSGYVDWSYLNRFNGRSVRPVCE